MGPVDRCTWYFSLLSAGDLVAPPHPSACADVPGSCSPNQDCLRAEGLHGGSRQASSYVAVRARLAGGVKVGGQVSQALCAQHTVYRIIESLRLEKTSQIIKSNRQPNTATPATPCPEVPYVYIFLTPPGMGTPPPPWAACSNAWPLFQ